MSVVIDTESIISFDTKSIISLDSIYNFTNILFISIFKVVVLNIIYKTIKTYKNIFLWPPSI
jgi:hypothetical protein